MISFILLALVYGSNAVALSKVMQGDVDIEMHPVTEEMDMVPTGNSTLKPQTVLAKIKADPKKFVSELENLDPAALRHIISLLEELLESSEARKTELVNTLQDANNALDTANTDVLNALDDLTAAQARTAAAIAALNTANQEKTAADADELAVSTDLEEKRQVHTDAQTAQETAQTAHDDELPGLNNEQQVLRDVIAMLKGLPSGGSGDCEEATALDNPFPVIAGAKWEFTNDWDCGGNDIGVQSAMTWDGSAAAIERRMDCAQKCLDAPNCVAFNYPQPGNGNCWWKHSYEKSAELGKDCGSSTNIWQYYTLLDKNPCNA